MMRLKKKSNAVMLVDNGFVAKLRANNAEGMCIGNVAKLLAPSETEPGKIREDEKYIYPVFRALSKIVIPGYWLNFSLGDVLKKSVELIKHQTVYPNHDTDVEKWLGVVEDSVWSQNSEPAGIDITLKIDKVINPRIAEGLKMRPPALHSGSAGIRFKWVKSHPDLEGFWNKLGTTVENKLVTIDITEITSYTEFSVVYQGADPYAKQQLRVADFGNEDYPDAATIADADASLNENTHAQEETNVKLKKKQCEKLGLKTETLFAKGDEIELSQEQFDALMLDAERVHSAAAQALTDQANEIAALKPKAELGEKYEAAQRDEADKFYRLCNPESVDEGMVKALQTLPLETVQALAKDYKARAEKLHPGKDRQSSVTEGNSQQTSAGEEDVSAFKIK